MEDKAPQLDLIRSPGVSAAHVLASPAGLENSAARSELLYAFPDKSITYIQIKA